MRPPRPEERRTDLRKSCLFDGLPNNCPDRETAPFPFCLWDGIPDNCPARYREGRAPGAAPAAAPDE